MGRVSERRRVLRVDVAVDGAADGAVGGEVSVERTDTLAGEEPLETRIAGHSVAVTMRTPGDDFDLVAGFAWSEGLITRPDQLAGLRYCAGADDSGRNSYNVVDIVLAADAPVPEPSIERNFYTTSSCGVCGKASIDAVRVRSSFDLRADPTTVAASTLAALPQRLRAAQKVFERTGGLHAAGLFTPDGELLVLREDVGRHNAVDKVVGWALREDRLPLSGTVLMVSGRASFELVQKAYVAGIPVLAAVSAPSTLAVEFAESVGLTVVGFLRGTSMNVYTRPDRLGLQAS